MITKRYSFYVIFSEKIRYLIDIISYCGKYNLKKTFCHYLLMFYIVWEFISASKSYISAGFLIFIFLFYFLIFTAFSMKSDYEM